MAVQHTFLTIIWNMAHTGELYNDLGADYYSHLRPDRTKARVIRQLEAWDTVTLERAGWPSPAPTRESSSQSGQQLTRGRRVPLRADHPREPSQPRLLGQLGGLCRPRQRPDVSLGIARGQRELWPGAVHAE